MSAPVLPQHVNLPFALSTDQRVLALERTTKTLQELDKIRRGLDMPMEHLPLVIEIHDKIIAALYAEGAREEARKNIERVPLTMRSETNDRSPMRLTRGKQHVVSVRPNRRAFRPEDFSIRGEPTDWLVHDILVGNRSQLEAKHGPIPGREFGPNGACARMSLETVQTAMDLDLVVEYVGPELDGAVFEATVIGTAAKI